ncbi:MAG: homoserine kinase, partial [Gaiellaceae bacterium]
EQVPFGDAVYTVGRAAALGAAMATQSEDLFAMSLTDRLHEPYRAEHAPLLEEVRSDLPPGARGATISGSGPTVIVWAEKHSADDCAVALSSRFPDVEVLWLKVSEKGAEVT